MTCCHWHRLGRKLGLRTALTLLVNSVLDMKHFSLKFIRSESCWLQCFCHTYSQRVHGNPSNWRPSLTTSECASKSTKSIQVEFCLKATNFMDITFRRSWWVQSPCPSRRTAFKMWRGDTRIRAAPLALISEAKEVIEGHGHILMTCLGQTVTFLHCNRDPYTRRLDSTPWSEWK